MKTLIASLLLLAGLVCAGQARAAIDVYTFESDAQEQTFRELTKELRCPKCQNQDIADCNAPIAADLRKEIFRMLGEGKDNQQPLWDAMGELLGDKIKAVHFKGKNFAPDGTMLHTSLEDSCTDYAGAFAMLRTLPQPLPVLREEAVPARAASDIAFIKQFF